MKKRVRWLIKKDQADIGSALQISVISSELIDN